MGTAIFILLFMNIFIVACDENCFYWKIYDGSTPEDAVEGGKDADGNTFYIALVHLKFVNEILPGMIIPKRKAAHVSSYAIAFDVKNDANNEVKILCSKNKEVFEWVSTSSANLHLLTNKNLVPGGLVLGQNLYIGRVRHNGGVVLGKVFPHTFIFQGLWIPSGATHFQYLTFEVLAYDCTKIKKNQTNMDKIIDEIFSNTKKVENVFSGV